MKFLVLALCVCAASAASFGSGSSGPSTYKKYQGFGKPIAAPAVVAAKAVASAAAPVFAPVAAAPVVVPVAAYQAAKQVAKTAYSSEDGQAVILSSKSDSSPDGYQYAFETGNGISIEAAGAYKTVGEAGGVVSQGSYRYTAPDGTPVLVTYTADENGYKPQSDILPVGPETPEAILRSVAYIAAKSTIQN